MKDLGRIDSTSRTPEQTAQARFWTDHDIRQWNDGMLRLAAARGLDLVQTARMLAMAHVAGGDAMIACFDAKYHYWFWRPYQAIPLADTDGNPATVADPTWQPLGATPNFPEYPSAHACHSTAVVDGARRVLRHRQGSVLARQPGHRDDAASTAASSDVVKDVDAARVLVGFHFLSSDLEGSTLGRKVGDVRRRPLLPAGRPPLSCFGMGGGPTRPPPAARRPPRHSRGASRVTSSVTRSAHFLAAHRFFSKQTAF